MEKTLREAATREIHCFDPEAARHVLEQPGSLEKKFLGELCRVSRQPEKSVGLLSRYTQDMRVNLLREEDSVVLLWDELLDSTLLEFFMVVYYWADRQADDRERVRCFRRMVFLLDAQCLKHDLPDAAGKEDIRRMFTHSERLTVLAADSYWSAWNFMMAHELGHRALEHKPERRGQRDELEADAYAYRLFLNMLVEQKEGNLPSDCRVFGEEMYLAPMMLFDFHDLIFYFAALIYKRDLRLYHPSSETRKTNLFEQDIPDCLDMTLGNELYNIFLNVIDEFKAWLVHCARHGKLDVIKDYQR